MDGDGNKPQPHPFVVLISRFGKIGRVPPLADPHQVMTIIATAISDCRKAREGTPSDPEEAKQIAKCICEALSDAGLQIVPAVKD